ncbi:MAG: hypothetical protein ACFE89_09545 [Candidatus Hodarchaeota archaeon]
MFLTPQLLADFIAFGIEVVVAFVAFFFAGRLLTRVNTKITDALFVALLGLIAQLVIDIIMGYYLPPGLNPLVVLSWDIVGLLATFSIWMILVQHFFDTLFFRGLTIVIFAIILIAIIDFGTSYLFPILFPGP